MHVAYCILGRETSKGEAWDSVLHMKHGVDASPFDF